MEIQLGLKENRKQFFLLVLINAFVGGMVGLERTILPEIAVKDFKMVAASAILSFIIVFGISKAIANYFTGVWANRFGRKKILVTGWLFALPVPFLLIYAPDWNWIIAANVLLGISQGITWSSTVIMKIDLVGEKQRGLAMGINEFAGYWAVALVAFFTGWVAVQFGTRPYPFIVGIVIAALGLTGSIFLVKDTTGHVEKELSQTTVPQFKNIFWQTTWKHKNLGSVTQAGLINNLNDGLAWGLFPLLLTAKGFSLEKVGIVTAIYPAVWGAGQLFTGKLADIFCKKDLLYTGMLLQGIALLGFAWANTLWVFLVMAVLLGLGTALVYPTFLATVAENTHPADRSKSIGIFRLWRDLGYAIGAILTGAIADTFGVQSSIIFVAILTIISAAIIYIRMKCMDFPRLKFKEGFRRIGK